VRSGKRWIHAAPFAGSCIQGFELSVMSAPQWMHAKAAVSSGRAGSYLRFSRESTCSSRQCGHGTWYSPWLDRSQSFQIRDSDWIVGELAL
jgi:hypothetical protein